jgi:hypothetical protein
MQIENQLIIKMKCNFETKKTYFEKIHFFNKSINV